MNNVELCKVALLEAEFYQFRGFSASKIERLKVRFEECLQILNSTNGTGKSTFMQELSAKTINKDLFNKQGYKTLLYELTYSDGTTKQYRIHSTHKTNMFVDIETDENLNSSGTITEHNTLLQSIFRVTPYAWSIAMGTVNFTSLDKTERRKWIETISGVDFTFAFDLYDKIVKRISGTKQSLKIIGNDLVAAQERLISSEDLLKLSDDKKVLVELTNGLMGVRDTSVDVSWLQKIESRLESLKARAEIEAKGLDKAKSSLTLFPDITSIDELDTVRQQQGETISLLKQEIDNLVSLLTDKEALLNRINEVSGLNKSQIEQRCENAKQAVSQVESVFTDRGGNRYNELFTDMDAVENILKVREIVHGFSNWCFVQQQFETDACLYPFTSEKRADHYRTVKSAREDMLILKTKMEELETHVGELTEGKPVTCPQCQHIFKDGVDKIESLRDKWRDFKRRRDALRVRAVDNEEQVSRYDSVDGVKRVVSQWLRKFIGPQAPHFSRTAIDMVDSGTDLRVLSQYLNSAVEMALLKKDFFLKQDALKGLELLKEKFDAVDSATDLTALEAEVELTRQQLIAKRALLAEKQSLSISLDKCHKDASSQIERYNAHIGTLREIHKYKEKYRKVINECMASTILEDLQVKLATVSSQLNSNDSTQTLVDSLKGMLDKQESDLATLSDLHKAMSPNGGIISEQLVGYCTTFADKLTEVLKSVWGYPLSVLPCINKNQAIDYKFPIELDGGIVKDIALGSKAMRSIINLAIMLCTRSALKLNHLPLFLDEVGDGLDVVHNEKLRVFIKQLIREGVCSNIFFVDHDVNNRAALGDYNEIVFNASQVITGSDYNQFVEIEYY